MQSLRSESYRKCFLFLLIPTYFHIIIVYFAVVDNLNFLFKFFNFDYRLFESTQLDLIVYDVLKQ